MAGVPDARLSTVWFLPVQAKATSYNQAFLDVLARRSMLFPCFLAQVRNISFYFEICSKLLLFLQVFLDVKVECRVPSQERPEKEKVLKSVYPEYRGLSTMQKRFGRKFLFNFRKRKLYIFKLHFIRTLRYLFKKFKNFSFFFFCPPKHKKTSPQKLLIIPLDHQFSVQRAFWNWENSEKFWNFLIFEVVKLCRMKK